ncbi:hypothetical protein SCHPADRAFT_990208, partial [Schizopora paradoxa]
MAHSRQVSDFELSASTLRTNSKALTLSRKLVVENMLDLFGKVLSDFRPGLRPELPDELKKNERASEYGRDREEERARVPLFASLVAAMKDLPGNGVRQRATEWLELRRHTILLTSAESWSDARGKAWSKACEETWCEELDEATARRDVEQSMERTMKRYYAKISAENDKWSVSSKSEVKTWFDDQSTDSPLSKKWDAALNRKIEVRDTWSIERAMVKMWNGMIESSSEKDVEWEEVVWKKARARMIWWARFDRFGPKFYALWSKDWNSAWNLRQMQMQTQKPTSKPAEFWHYSWNWMHSWNGGWIIRVIQQRYDFTGFKALDEKSPQWKELDWVLLQFWWFGVDEWVLRFRDRRRIVFDFKETCVEFLKELARLDGSASLHELNILNRFPSACQFEESRLAATDLDGIVRGTPRIIPLSLFPTYFSLF